MHERCVCTSERCVCTSERCVYTALPPTGSPVAPSPSSGAWTYLPFRPLLFRTSSFLGHIHMDSACPIIYTFVHRHEQNPSTGHTIPQTQAITYTLAPCAEMQNPRVQATCAHHSPQPLLTHEPECAHNYTPVQIFCACTHAQRCNRTHVYTCTHMSHSGTHTMHAHNCMHTAWTHKHITVQRRG